MSDNVSLADIAAVTDRNGYGYGNGWGNNGMFGMEWIFALLILPMLWGGNGPFGRNGGESPVTESGLCNAMNFNNLEGAVGRLGDQVGNAYTGLQNGLCNLGYTTLENFNSLERLVSNCCCETKQIALENRYLSAQNTAAINANTTAQVQKVLDAICGNRMADMQNQINQLQLQNAVAGVVRYPNQTTYATACNPFFGAWGCGCNSGCNNI